MAGSYGSGAYVSPEGASRVHRVGQSSWQGGWRMISRGLAKPDWVGQSWRLESRHVDIRRYGGGGLRIGASGLDYCVEVAWDRLDDWYWYRSHSYTEVVPWAVLVPDGYEMPYEAAPLGDDPESVRQEVARRERRLVFGEAGGVPAAVVSSGVDAMGVEFSPRVEAAGDYVTLAEATEIVCNRLDAHDVRVAVTPRRDEVGAALLGQVHVDFRPEKPEAGIGVWPMCWRGLLDKPDFDAAGEVAAAQIRRLRSQRSAVRPDFPSPPVVGRLYRFGSADDGDTVGTRLYAWSVTDSRAVDRNGLVCEWDDPFSLTERSQAMEKMADHLEYLAAEDWIDRRVYGGEQDDRRDVGLGGL